MYSFLEEINNYVLDNGIPFKNISISSSYFPDFFNRAMLRELRNAAGGKWVDYEIENYELVFEENRLQLVARSKNKHTVLVIFNKNLWFSIKEPSKKLFETNITTLAMYLERKEFDEIKKYIDSKGLTGRYNLEHVNIEESLKETALKCIDYISYLNKFYMKQLEDNEKEEREKKMVSLNFNSPEVSASAPRNYEKLGGISRERVNSILPLDERVKVLESYDYMYVGYATSNDADKDENKNKEIAYLNYLYSLGHNKYALVMEPYSGTSYTKIMIFENEEQITKEMFSKLVKDTLELSYDELNSRSNIIKTNHTTIDTFGNLLEYIVKNSNTTTLLNGYTKKKIENLKR
ncbi:MAG: hypothetical protein IJE89_03570 [Bacilli bacterium]|nr:hypothetical protein [Bacilli bacterium]